MEPGGNETYRLFVFIFESTWSTASYLEQGERVLRDVQGRSESIGVIEFRTVNKRSTRSYD